MPGADHPPGFMTVLAGFSWLGFRSFFQHQVISCVIGATGVAAMGVAGRRIAGERVGLIVAVLAALSPNLFYFDAMVVSESMMVATTAAILWAVYRWWDRPSLRSAAVFGLVIGVAALVRSESILLGPLLAVPLVWWRARRAPAGETAPEGDGSARRRGWTGWAAPARGRRPRGGRRRGAVGRVQHVPLRGADHVVGPARPDVRHGQLRVRLRGRPGRLLVAVVHPGDRAPGARGRCLGPGQGVPRDRLPVRPRPPRPRAVRGGGPGGADVRPVPAPGAAAARHVGRPEGDRARADRDGGLVRHRRRRRHRADRPAPRRAPDLPDRRHRGQRRRGGGPRLRKHPLPASGRAGADDPGGGLARRRPGRDAPPLGRLERRAARPRRRRHRQPPGPRHRRRRGQRRRDAATTATTGTPTPRTPRATPPPIRPAGWARRAGGSPGSTACGHSPHWACWSPTSG